TAEPVRRVGRRWIAFIALANLGLYLGYFGPITVLLPNQVQAIAGPAHKVAVLGWVTGIGAAVAMISNPVAGALSDRTTSRFGRRHPWWGRAGGCRRACPAGRLADHRRRHRRLVLGAGGPERDAGQHHRGRARPC